jgi:hypothetical protein
MENSMTRIAPHPLSAAFSAALMIGGSSVGALAAFAPPAEAARPEARTNVAPTDRVAASRIVVRCNDADEASVRDAVAMHDDARSIRAFVAPAR